MSKDPLDLTALGSTKPSVRAAAIQQALLHINSPDIQISTLQALVLGILPFLSTFTAAEHTPSSITALLFELLQHKEGFPKLTNGVVKHLASECEQVRKSTIDPANVLGIISSTVVVFSIVTMDAKETDGKIALREGISEETWTSLVLAFSTLVDFITDKSRCPKDSMRRSGLVILRRGVRNSAKFIPMILITLLKTSPSPPWKHTACVGLICDVSTRLKDTKADKGRNVQITAEIKPLVDAHFKSLLTPPTTLKASPPDHIVSALNDFFRFTISTKEDVDPLIPQIVEGVTKSPLIVAPFITSFFSVIDAGVVLEILESNKNTQVLMDALVVNTRSTVQQVRSSTVSLFSTIISRLSSPALERIGWGIVDPIVSVLKSGKTASPDHRITLFDMLTLIPSKLPLQSSLKATECSVSLLKDPSPLVLAAAFSTIATHLPQVLTLGAQEASVQKDLKSFFSIFSKLGGDSKAAVRAHVAKTLGSVTFSSQLNGENSDAARTLWASSLGVLIEAWLKTGSLATPVATSSTATASGPASPVEAYIAISILGHISTWGDATIDKIVATNPIFLSLCKSGAPTSSGTSTPTTKPKSTTVKTTPVSSKPSFLLWDKIYRKTKGQPEEEYWFLQALKTVIRQQLAQSSLSQRDLIGSAIVYLAVEGGWKVRKDAIQFVEEENTTSSAENRKWLSTLVLDGIKERFLLAEKDKEREEIHPNLSHCKALIGALVKPSGEKNEALDQSLCEVLVLAHHPFVLNVPDVEHKLMGEFWISIAQAVHFNLQEFVSQKVYSLKSAIWAYMGECQSVYFVSAAYAAVSTLTFVNPGSFLSVWYQQIQNDLSVETLTEFGATEFGIWKTPEGTCFDDPLSNQKPKAVVTTKNTKEAELLKWEAELRESIAKKKGASATLSKTDLALVNKQLFKEAEIRQRVQVTVSNVVRGFNLVQSLVASTVDDIQSVLTGLINSVLKVVEMQQSVLFASDGYKAFQALGTLCSSRLGTFSETLGASVLRALESPVVPSTFEVEPLGDLVTRVLQRLHFLSSQTPFDSATFAFVSPLIQKVVVIGGLGLAQSDAEGALEQVTLALDFIAFHCRQSSDIAFPRLPAITNILAVLGSFPTLTRAATAALLDLSEAMKENVTFAEIDGLLNGLMVEESYTRFACLQALGPLDLTDLEFPPQLWIACHDVDERNVQLALSLWDENAFDVSENFLPTLLPSLSHSSSAIRNATAGAIGDAVTQHPTLVSVAFEALSAEYLEKAKEILPQYDHMGMLIPESLTVEDPWKSRVAIASTLALISKHFSQKDVEAFFTLLIQKEALGDRNEAVRSTMLDAGIEVVDKHGGENLQALIATFEEFLSRPSGGEVQDMITESLIILFGRLARHLSADDPRVMAVIGRLVEALKTPSELVQEAVCLCLPPLVRMVPKEIPTIVEGLFEELFKAPKYAARRGAAYGLAGVVRGRGIPALREFAVFDQLRESSEDKKNMHGRQGSMFAYEILSLVLGRLFEPYLVEILPILLTSLGDSSTEVREATQAAAKGIMSKLSGHAVKLILPTLLEGLEEKQWRAKKGAIELIGAMAFLAPRQLSASLPDILPRLTEVITDTHKQVRESANTSLKRFGDVVTNPEIKEIQSTLLDALVDPSRKTPKALDKLLATTFAHFIDSSSLALVVPIIDRGLRERSADIKRKASAIVGNMATLTESQDLIPYLNQLVPLIRGVLVDPVPEARSTAAKSLGSLVERLGEENFPNLVDSLMLVLKSPSSGVDQQGAAQGVSEILAGLGVDRLEEVLPDVLANTSSPRAYVREGHISLLVFLPSTFGDRFAPYLGKIITPVLNGLADDSDYVREASMRAGRMIVANHSSKAIDLLLPELENGIFDNSWRIRQSSVQLVGDLLFRLTGVSGRSMDEEEEEGDEGDEQEVEDTNPATEAGRKILLEALGKERRDRVLSSLYIVRYDAVAAVRQAALHVWKAIVTNTPKTTREILPILMQLIVRTLASPGIEQRETAARCLAETCRKLGEAVLGEVVSILQKAMVSPDRRQREGVCVALAEIMDNTTPSSLETHESTIIAIVRDALVDPEADVRSAAAKAFDVAQQIIGPKSIDETIPTLLDALHQSGDTAGAALEALKEVMSVRADKIFPVLTPRLLTQPITAFNARALSSLVRVAGSALRRRLTHIVDCLQIALDTEQSEDTKNEIDAALTSVLASADDEDTGLDVLQMHLLSLAKALEPSKRVIGASLFGRFCRATSADFSEFNVDWIRQLVSMMDDTSSEVIDAAWEALDGFVKTIDKVGMEPLVVPLRRTIESTGLPGKAVDGFSRPNGLKPLLPILLQGLLSGTAEQREQAAFGIGDLVERTAPEAFKSYCIQTVGPLIRVIGDRFPAPVKGAILATLTTFLENVPQFVKPFFPQLQRTFVKSITDTNSQSVRNKGVTAIGALMKHQPRIDPLIVELLNLDGSEEGEVRDSVVNALAAVVKSGGAGMSETSKSSIIDLLGESFAENHKENYCLALSRLMASLASHDVQALHPIIDAYLLSDLPPTQLTSLAIREIVEQTPRAFYDLQVPSQVVKRVKNNMSTVYPPTITRPARDTVALFQNTEPWCDDETITSEL